MLKEFFTKYKLFLTVHITRTNPTSHLRVQLTRAIFYSFLFYTVYQFVYFRPVRPKLQYSAIAWIFITSTVIKKLERFPWQFVAKCQYRLT